MAYLILVWSVFWIFILKQGPDEVDVGAAIVQTLNVAVLLAFARVCLAMAGWCFWSAATNSERLEARNDAIRRGAHISMRGNQSGEIRP